MCKCTPEMKTPFCGKPGCEWPEQKPKPSMPGIEELAQWVKEFAYAAEPEDVRIAGIIAARLRSKDKALGEIARQELRDEMHPDFADGADYETGYESCVLTARKAREGGE